MVGIVWCFLVSKLSFLMEHVTFWLEFGWGKPLLFDGNIRNPLLG